MEMLMAVITVDFELIVTNSIGCSDTIVKQVEVFDQPNASFTYAASCPGNQVIINFTDNSTSTDPINYWFYDFGGQGSNASANPTQLFNTDGDYTITHIVSTTHGCSDTVEQMISVPAIPVAGFYYNTSNGMNVGAIFNFVDTSLYSTNYSWQFGDGNSSILQNPSNTYFANGEYLVTQYAYGALGCYDSTSTVITINTVTTEINTLIPNAISPNDDNTNDVWEITGVSNYPNCFVRIFDRWGQEVFQSTGYSKQKAWDGTGKAGKLAEGVYFYIVELRDPDKQEFKGSITLIR